jgi:hypothetical protein
MQAGAVRGRQLAIEIVLVVTWRRKQVAVNAFEVAGNPFARDDRVNAIDGGGVAFGGKAGATLSVPTLQLEVAIVKRIG